MKTELELALEKSEPLCILKGLDKSHFELISCLYKGNSPAEIAAAWGKSYTAKIINNLILVIYRILNLVKLITTPKINSYTRLFKEIGLIPS